MTQRRSKRIYFILYLLYFVLLMLHHILAPVFHSLAAVRFQLLPRTVYELLILAAAVFLLCGRSYLNARLPRTGGVLWGQAGLSSVVRPDRRAALALRLHRRGTLWTVAELGQSVRPVRRSALPPEGLASFCCLLRSCMV